MEPYPDYKSIVLSPPFTFLIGPNHTKLTIQSALARHVSQPLDHLMNNGVTRESKHRIALVEDEDPETFVAFCEYAYTADYTVPVVSVPVCVPVRVPGSGLSGLGDRFRSRSRSRFGDGDGDGDEDSRRDADSIGSPVPSRLGHRMGLFSGRVPPPVPSPPPRGQGGEEDGGAGSGGGGGDIGPFDAPNMSMDAPAAEDEHGNARKQIESGPSTHQMGASEGEGEGADRAKDHLKRGRRRKKQPAIEAVENITPPWSPPEKKQMEKGTSSHHPFRAEMGGAGAGAGAVAMVDTGNWEEAVASTEADDDEDEEPRQRQRQRQQQQQQQQQRPKNKSRAERKKDSEFSLWDEFVSLNYYYHHININGNRRRPPHDDDGDSNNHNHNHKHTHTIPYLVFHAKVYVFATRYLIPALAQLCLKKLHRDLLNLSFPGPKPDCYDDDDDDEEEDRIALTMAKAKMVLALVHFTYTRTSRLEPVVVQVVSPTVASGHGTTTTTSRTPATRLRDNELRKLVVHYAACKIRDLAEYCPSESGGGGVPAVSITDEKRNNDGTSSNNNNAWESVASQGGLRGLMDRTTELASDLVYRMM